MYIVSNELSQWEISLEEARQSEKLASVTIIMKNANTANFMEIPPEERKAIIRKTLQQQYAKLKKDFALKNIKLNRLKVEPRVLEAQVMLKDLFSLEKKEYVLNIIVNEIDGVAPKPSEDKDKEQPEFFFAVKARYAILIEGRTKGLQAYEDRIILLKAKNEEEAEKKAMKLFAEPVEPYLNSDKRYVWFKFEEIIGIQETEAREFNDLNKDGIELYSEMKDRRMKPGDEWILPYRTKG